MIYLKNNTETQSIYIPRQTVLSGGYIATTEKYEEGYNDGFKDGKEQQKSKLESINITENGQYEREDGWNVVTVDVHTEGGDAYNTIDDIYGSPSDSTVTFKGLVALSFKYGRGYNILLTDNTGSIILKNYQEPLRVGDECLVTATLRRNALSYISYLLNSSVEVLSSNNYVVMPTDAVGLTNLDDIYMPNENGYAEMKYLYADGTVVLAPSSNLMQIETDATVPDNIGLRGNFSKWETKLVEGDNIRVYMFPENNQKYFWVTDIIKLGAEGGGCPELTTIDITENGSYEGAFNIVNVNVPQEGGSCNLINPIVFSKEAGNTINAENVQIPTFVYEGNQYYNVWSIRLDSYEAFKIQILFKPNNSGDAEPINIFGCEDTDWDNTTFGARIYQGQIYFRMSGEDVAYPYTENTWYNVEMGYNTTKRWVIVNRETLLETGHTEFNRPNQDFMVGAIKSGGNAFRPFYGKIAAIYAEEGDSSRMWILPKEDGTMDVYVNNINNPYATLSGENNARFENDSISGDGMKSITLFSKGSEGEGGSCNLEDKWVTPSMSDRDGNNLIVVGPSEGYDGLSRTVIDPQTIYNEGVEAGRAEGGGGGSCNLGVLDWTLTSPNGQQKNASDDGYDGYSAVVVRPENIIAQEKENAINDFKNKMKEITVTENGTYSIDDQEARQYIEFDGNSYFDSNIPFGENTKIEVAILKTTYEEDEQFIGCANYDLSTANTYGGFGIVLGAGLAYGVFGKTKTTNIPFSYEEEQILTLDRNGIHSSFRDRTEGWIDDSQLNSNAYGLTIGIGKIKSLIDGWVYRGLNGRIRYVKIWTNKDDDSTMTLFRPKNIGEGAFGVVNSEGIENSHIENLGSGTATFVDEWVKKYPYGFKRVEVNVDATPSTIGGIKFGNSTFEECTFNLEGIEDFSYLFENCRNLRTSPSIQKAIKNARNMFRGCSSLTTAPTYNTSEATDLGGMYAGCHNLTSVGAVNCSSLPNTPIGSNKEASIFDTNQYLSLTDFGGFLNLKQSVDLSGLIALSNNSVENIFNNLYDFSGNGETPNEIQGHITMSNFITDAVEQYRTIAESKGWTITIK